MVGIVATAVDTVLDSVFRVIRTGLVAVLGVVRIVSTGIKNTVDALMLFLRDGVGALLIFLGSLRVFQLVFHLAQVLPAVLPGDRAGPRQAAVQGGDGRARHGGVDPAADRHRRAGLAVPIAAFPDLADKLLPGGRRPRIVGRVDSMGKTIRTEAGVSFGAVQGAFDGIGKKMQDTVGTLDKGLDRDADARLATAKGHAQQLADSLKVARGGVEEAPRDGARGDRDGVRELAHRRRPEDAHGRARRPLPRDARPRPAPARSPARS